MNFSRALCTKHLVETKEVGLNERSRLACRPTNNNNEEEQGEERELAFFKGQWLK
jgi:hypothetical protein